MDCITRREVVAGIAASLALPSLPAHSRDAAVPNAGALLDEFAWRLMQLEPERATALGVDTGRHAALRGRLENRSLAGLDERRRFVAEALQRVKAFPRAGLDAGTVTSLEVVESAFAIALEGMSLPYGDATIGSWRNTPYVVIQNVGGYIDLPQLLDGDQPVNDAADAEAYLSRLAAMPGLLDGELERVRVARAKGLVAPDFLLEKTARAMTGLLANAADAKGPLLAPLLRKTDGIPGRWEAHAVQLVTRGVLPALERQRAEIESQRAAATGEAGLLKRPHGPEWYAWGLRASTTTRRTPEELHAMGVEQLAELHARMDVILRDFGLTQGTVGERTVELQKRPELNFPADDAGRAQIVAYMQGRLDAMRAQLPRAFRNLTRGFLEIRRLPLVAEPGAPAAYGGPGSIDGTVPGKVWVNLLDPSIHNKVTIPDLMFHEGIPGHVWQGEYAQRLPLIRSLLSFNAYSEGWALYAEQLADELGLYDDDPAGRLGYLMGMSWRAVRLVVDTGLHAMGWTRERALEEFVAATGLPRSNAISEVERYCSWPGQACGYKVGHTEINVLRTRAQAALGAKYDLRDFDQALVDGGNVPLDVLAKNVERYVEGAKRG